MRPKKRLLHELPFIENVKSETVGLAWGHYFKKALISLSLYSQVYFLFDSWTNSPVTPQWLGTFRFVLIIWFHPLFALFYFVFIWWHKTFPVFLVFLVYKELFTSADALCHFSLFNIRSGFFIWKIPLIRFFKAVSIKKNLYYLFQCFLLLHCQIYQNIMYTDVSGSL